MVVSNRTEQNRTVFRSQSHTQSHSGSVKKPATTQQYGVVYIHMVFLSEPIITVND
jgi:hypothetical protein